MSRYSPGWLVKKFSAPRALVANFSLGLVGWGACALLSSTAWAQAQPPPTQQGFFPVQPTQVPGSGGSPANPSESPDLLRPPAPLPPSPEETETLRRLDTAEHRDSGRGLQFFWMEPEAGYQFAFLDAFSSEQLVEDALADVSGPSLGAAVGARFLYYTLGARFRYRLLGDVRLWSLGGEIGLRVPLGKLEPYGFLGGGYIASTRVSGDVDGIRYSQVKLKGGLAYLGGGVNYFLSPAFSVGAKADVEALFLSREKLDVMSDSPYSEPGSAVGFAVTPALVLGLHY